MFFIINDEKLCYRDTPRQAALAAGSVEWNCAELTRAISALNPGDELSVDAHTSVIRLTGVDIDYTGTIK